MSSSSSAGSSSVSNAASDEFDSIKNILHSLGINDYDPLVVVALSEYARRYASEMLCDMKDYSVHANKPEIDMDDMKIATHLSNVKTAGFTPSVNTSLAIFHEVNKKPIPEISNSAILHRIPGVASSEADSKNGQVQRELDLLTPTFSFVPGVEAYPTINSIVSRKAMREGTADQLPQPGSSAKKSKFVHHSQGSTPIPISLMQMRERENYRIQERHTESMNKNQRAQLGSHHG